MTNTDLISAHFNPTPHVIRDDVAPGIPGASPPSPPPPSRQTRLKVANLMATEFPPQRFVVDGLLPVGLCMLAGAPKVGKSWLSLDLALSVAAGRPCLGRPTDQGAVLYLALEDTPRRLQDRLHQLGENIDWEDLPLEIWTDVDPVDAGGLNALRDWLEAASTPRLIIVDIWGRFDSRGTSTKNEYDRITQIMQPLQVLAGEFGVAVVLIHHTKKSGGDVSVSSDPFDQVMGSRALTSNMDLTMMLTRTRMQRDAVLSMTGRDVEEGQLNVTFDKSTCRWHAADHDGQPALSPEKQAVLDAVHAGHTKAPAIAAHLGKGRTVVTNHLTDLVRDGHLVRPRTGEYAPAAGSSDAGPLPAELPDMADSGDIRGGSLIDDLV